MIGCVIRRAVFASAALCTALYGFAWGQKGHDVTAYIAEQHLTEATVEAVGRVLDGMSPVYWANWLDNASHTPEYAYSKTWHYKNVDADKTYLTQPQAPDGDVVTAVRYNIGVLSDPAKSHEEQALAMKMLVHLVGDMHQPMHMGHATDLGGNRVKVRYFGRDTNLHSIWDSNLLESAHRWSYTEWQQQIDRMDDAEGIVAVGGNLDDWARRTQEVAARVYDETPDGSSLSYNQVARWAPVIEEQLVLGGRRLAHILNSIYDPGYTHRKNPSDF